MIASFLTTRLFRSGIGDHRCSPADTRSRGVALVAVLWISSLLALLAAGAVSSSRTDIRLAYNLAEQAKARALADAGVHHALYELATKTDGQLWQDGVISFQLALDGGDVRFRVRDEDAKLDINAASIELLGGLFKAVGLDEEQARTLADRIKDFRDKDSEPSPFGAEDDDYIADGRREGAADRPFVDISELADVIGMTDEIYRLVRPHVTIYADVDGLDPSRALATTLQALPGVTPELAATITALPPGSDLFNALPQDLAKDIESYLVPSRELMFSIESLGQSGGGGRFLREAIVALDGGSRRLPFTVYAWTRGHPKAP